MILFSNDRSWIILQLLELKNCNMASADLNFSEFVYNGTNGHLTLGF